MHTGYLIHSSIEHYAKTTPEHPALSFQGQSMSYSELDTASNKLANALIESGAKPQDRVGIYHHKSLELGVAIYGILKAGCIFVPLDPFMPAERLTFIIKDCDIQLLVSSDSLLSTLEQIPSSEALTIFGVSEPLPFEQVSWNDIQTFSGNNPETVMIDRDLAYIMYTSGSTGQPKGMMHSHLGSRSYARWGAEHVDIQPQDRVASHAPLHFDLSIFDFFSTSHRGATVVLVPEAVTRFPASWTKTIQDERISVVFTVPYTLITMIDQGALDERDLSSLRWVLFGGEPYPIVQLRQFVKRLPNVRLTNVYGPAEAPSCTCHDITDKDLASDEPLPIGLVSRNSHDLIIDDNDEQCPDDIAGELCIGSSTLTHGYWNRPELNKKAFLLREGRGQFPAIYFRTGDRVIRHEDGLLRFLGRLDRMIKTRGHRVELDEVESALTSHEAVNEAAAFTVPGDHGSINIEAAISFLDSAIGTEDDVMKTVRSKLPTYAVPRKIHVLDTLPHTGTGKIDRRTAALTCNAGVSDTP